LRAPIPSTAEKRKCGTVNIRGSVLAMIVRRVPVYNDSTNHGNRRCSALRTKTRAGAAVQNKAAPQSLYNIPVQCIPTNTILLPHHTYCQRIVLSPPPFPLIARRIC
jgi:hypothetical protein